MKTASFAQLVLAMVALAMVALVWGGAIDHVAAEPVAQVVSPIPPLT